LLIWVASTIVNAGRQLKGGTISVGEFPVTAHLELVSKRRHHAYSDAVIYLSRRVFEHGAAGTDFLKSVWPQLSFTTVHHELHHLLLVHQASSLALEDFLQVIGLLFAWSKWFLSISVTLVLNSLVVHNDLLIEGVSVH
jgi:hypothetical protein